MSSRLRIILFFFLVIFLATAGRLFFLQIVKGNDYEEAAENQQTIETAIESKRGGIFFKSILNDEERFIPAAITKKWWEVWASPKDIKEEEVEVISLKVAKILSLEEDMVKERLAKRDDPYEPLKKKIDKETLLKLKELGVEGLHWRERGDRFYPLETLASPLLGFLSYKEKIPVGQYGLEEFYNDVLFGNAGYVKGFKNSLGALIRPFAQISRADDGADLFLTIDYNIQLFLEKKLEEALEDFSAESASAVVMNPKTGAILAMSSLPSFNPNNYSEVEDVSLFLNPNIQELYEPGSVFKPITMAVGLDINVISPSLTYRDVGFVDVADARIKNSTGESYGVQTMTQVLEKSLNTGVVFVIKRIPKGVWRDYMEEFGFDELSGIDLMGEVRGDIDNISSGREVEIATSSFGQGIAVTPLALTRAISVIANKGELVRPYVVEKVVYANNREEVLEIKESKRVISEESAEMVTNMMVSVVDNGYGKQAQVAGYSVAGKTGTAQVPGSEGGYSDKTIHSFVGFAPAYNPAFVTLIKIDNPQGVRFSDRSTAPIFGELAEFILHYYDVEPDRPIVE